MLSSSKAGRAGFIIAISTVIWHLFHCALPLVIPIFLFFGLPLPHFLHQIKIPVSLLLVSIFWVIFYILRKKIVVFWVHHPFRKS